MIKCFCILPQPCPTLALKLSTCNYKSQHGFARIPSLEMLEMFHMNSFEWRWSPELFPGSTSCIFMPPSPDVDAQKTCMPCTHVPRTPEHFSNAVHTLYAVECIMAHNPTGHVVAGQKVLDCLCLFRVLEQNITDWAAHKQQKLIFLSLRRPSGFLPHR